MPMKLHAPAKINLTLEVLGRRPDGYHALRSLIVPLAFGDELTLEPADAFAFTCTQPKLATSDNLVVHAVEALQPGARVSIHLEKRVPVQAGLGGGSSDAAAIVLAAMNGALGPVGSQDWVAVARALGSDVPFFLCGTGALVEGTGERVTATGALPPWHVVVVKPPVAVSTAAAYAALDRTERPTRPRNQSVTLDALDALQRADFEATQRLLANDFHALVAAERAEVRHALDALREAGASHPLLSGSGSAVFALARDADESAAIVSRLRLPESYACISTRFMETPQWQTTRR